NAAKRSARRPQATTCQPPCTNVLAMAAPKPAVAPVMMTVLVFMDGCSFPQCSLFLERHGTDAGRLKFLLCRFQRAGAREGPQAYAIPCLAVDGDGLDLGAKSLESKLGLQRLGVTGIRERADLQQVLTAATGRRRAVAGVVVPAGRVVACGGARLLRGLLLLLFGFGLGIDLGVG